MRRRLRFVRILLDPLVFVAGLAVYALTKRTPLAAALSLRRLYVSTDGRLNDAGARVSSILHPPIDLPLAGGVLGRLDAPEISEIAHEIELKGFFVFDVTLDSSICERIGRFARETPAMLYPKVKGADDLVVYDPERPLAPRYEFEERRIFELNELQELATDETLMAVAQAYLRCRPINDLVAMWWSPPTGSAPSSEAAQLFHFDMDRLKFVKFFIYLTDVDSGHGPHVYVKGSHVRKPKPIRRDGRIPDEEILEHYGREAIVEITGERGTILAVDTRGFHKGKAPEAGDRLLLQVEYANSLFGMTYNRIVADESWSEVAKQQLRLYPNVFQRVAFPASQVAA